jgi:hypothetical protein
MREMLDQNSIETPVANAGGVTPSQVTLVQHATHEATALPIVQALVTRPARPLAAGNLVVTVVGICRCHCQRKTIASANAMPTARSGRDVANVSLPVSAQTGDFGLEPPAT